MNSNDIDSFDIRLELSTLKMLSDISKNLQSKRGIEYQFSSVVVSANIAEYILYLFILIFSSEVRSNCHSNQSKVGFEVIDPTGKLNSRKVEMLKYFSFKNKEEIMSLLTSILQNRDQVFHNLVRSHTKKINIDKAIEDINKDTIQLRQLASETFDDIWSKPKT